MTPVQFGFCMPAENRHPHRRATWIADLSRALTLIQGHFDSAWMVDHLMFDDADVLEGFTALTYLAALHPQLRFGHAVLCQSFRNPALVAKMAATLQFMSGGRYILGIGAGWHWEEYQAYGYDFPPGSVRVRQLAEAIQIIRTLWTADQVTFHGQHYQVVEARCQPRPDPPPIIMVGAFRPQMLRLAAQYADWWNVSSTSIRRYQPMVDALEQACAAIGRDPSTVRRSWIGGCACAPTAKQARALAEDRWSPDDDEDFGFAGTPRQLIAQIRPFIALGVDYFMFDCAGFPDLTTLHMLIEDVIPALNEG